MLTLLPADEARRVREFFLAAGYTEEGVTGALGTLHPPLPDAGNRQQLLERVSEPSSLHDLLRLFFLGLPVRVDPAGDRLPEWFVEQCVGCGLARRGAEGVEPAVLVVPQGRLLAASDLYSRLQSPESDHVLAVNPVARHLLNFTLRDPVEDTLDLCTGNGIHALVGAEHSRNVVATDLNARAVEFARFNAGLNGFDNIECLVGDGYTPVEGREFDLIVCNPPFVLTPTTRFLYRDNPMELDLFCRQLTREAPAHLKDGGYFQIICEWVQVKGQPWEERVAEWFAGCGCDAWVLKANTLLPESYARRRIEETSALESGGGGMPSLEEWLAYYGERGVEAVHGGLIALRRRDGENWTKIEEIQSNLDEPFGDAIRRGFAGRDFLAQHAADDRLLESRLRLASDARLEKDSVWTEGRWRTTARVELTMLGRTIGLEESMADFLTGFDGQRPLRELAGELTSRIGVEPSAVLGVVRALVERGVLVA